MLFHCSISCQSGTKQNVQPTTVRTPIGGVDVATKGQSRFGAYLGVGSKNFGGFGIGITAYQYGQGKISGKEAFVDSALGIIGLTGWGAPITIVYFGGKFLYEYYSGETIFEKPKQQITKIKL